MKKWDGVTVTIVLIFGLFIGVVLLGALSGNDNKQGNPFDIELTKTFSMEEQPLMGDPEAPVTIVEYGDYSCGGCQSWDKDYFPYIKQNFIDTGIANFRFVNYQFISNASVYGGWAAEEIYGEKPESFWEFHHNLFKAYTEDKFITQDDLEKIAREIGYEKELFQNETYLQHVLSDKVQATEVGVNSTPTVYINGEKVDAFDIDQISEKINEARKNEE